MAAAESPRDRSELHGLRFEGRHGVNPDEHERSQPFDVDVVLELDLEEAGRTDDLAATADYGEVFGIARAVVEGGHVDLIETLATRIADGVLEAHPAVAAVTVRVRKPQAPLPGSFDWAGVEIRRAR